MGKNKDKVIGVLLIIVGIILAGNILDIWDFNMFFPGWWTMFLIVPAIIAIATKGFNVGDVILLVVGIILLLGAWDIFDSRYMWRLFGPIVLVIVGISIIKPQRRKRSNASVSSESIAIYKATCSTGKFKNTSNELREVKLSATLGNIILDLRESNIIEGLLIEVDVFLGNVEILVPKDTYIEVISGTPILGSYNNKRSMNISGDNKIRLDYKVVLGVVNID